MSFKKKYKYISPSRYQKYRPPKIIIQLFDRSYFKQIEVRCMLCGVICRNKKCVICYALLSDDSFNKNIVDKHN